MNNFNKILFIIISVSLVTNVIAGETTRYTGTVYAAPVKSLMPLGNGDGVLIMHSAGIVAMSGDPPTINALSCSGIGIEKPDETTSTNFYCNIKENVADSFDIKGIAGDEKAGEFEVIGGSGKWTNATGKGKFVRVIETEEGNKNIFEVEITVP